MLRTIILGFIPCFFLLTACKKEKEDITISGRVLDAQTLAPVANVQIGLVNNGTTVHTNANGEYTFSAIRPDNNEKFAITSLDHYTVQHFNCPVTSVTNYNFILQPTAYIDFDVHLVDTACSFVSAQVQYGRYYWRGAYVYDTLPEGHAAFYAQRNTQNVIYVDVTKYHRDHTSDYATYRYVIDCPMTDTVHYSVQY